MSTTGFTMAMFRISNNGPRLERQNNFACIVFFLKPSWAKHHRGRDCIILNLPLRRFFVFNCIRFLSMVIIHLFFHLVLYRIINLNLVLVYCVEKFYYKQFY